MGERKVAIVTGTNSNLGLNIVYRLLEREDPDTRLTIVVTSRTLPRVREVIDQIKKYADKLNRPGVVDYDYLLVDFTNMVSVLSAYNDLKKYKAIHYFFVNAAQGVYDGIDWVGATKQSLTAPMEAVTNPNYRIQRVGVKSKDGMGLVFQANVFGPYYLIQKILPQLVAGHARIVWVSSLMSDPKYLSFNDLQMIKSDVTYEGSKRLVDLLHLASYKDLASKGIKQYLVHPGIFQSNSFNKFLNVFTYYGMLFMFYLARLLGSKWHNIVGYKAANAPVYVATMKDTNIKDQQLKYGSATTWDAREYIETQEIDSTGSNDVLKYMDNLKNEWDEKLKNQITNTRVPI
ncbi:hypothetical protein Kpol_1033p20 [Vanderwaltozyma polyspora DSM 70294]|uniref:3beta-hydroxysteroid 3-dehydrogenase n=1 Tax=Vanderwaltozyma polyspora (strain ATCC 22028 / DSM 70294 / BCRC 21397 / CBS 2163 / NBRC 10782 / NRRL Y-8283 / UCD 57-17) TaxID=436907 RepID=A7TJ17_VANPO|nr:uncharacterized protein Kpol_1033p20 [Vanderwaltozyma polyspora DSM 70294]EDO17716.1 hypothetical protein Kpol_1033p20 [Vanderwaltozyma polyspora DSM 70294]